VLLLFNLLAEFQRAASLPGYREPATIRTQVLTCGAIPGRSTPRLVLHMGQSWGGLASRKPLLDSILDWQIPTSPKLAAPLLCRPVPAPFPAPTLSGNSLQRRSTSEFRFSRSTSLLPEPGSPLCRFMCRPIHPSSSSNCSARLHSGGGSNG
jgi:hypothetical protein